MKLYDMLDRALLREMIREGYIREQMYPDAHLCILNYTDKAAYSAMWNDATLACRGLIYDMVDMTVVARPFSKFFNYEQLAGTLTGLVRLEDMIALNGRVQVTDKQDGSLGILYPLPDGTWAVATRGSFQSDQAIHATKVFNDKYNDGRLILDRGTTYLFEIIYPANRIVLNYGDMDDLVLLGAVVIETGLTVGPEEAEWMLNWTGPVTQTFEAKTFEAALALPPRDNAEGVVVLFRDGTRVKIKQADYIALHRIVTGMSDRTVWERLGKGETTDEIKEGLPDEFYPWVDDVSNRLHEQAGQILMSVWDAYNAVIDTLPDDFTRKDFALAVKDSPIKGYLFKYLDGQSIWDVVWRTLKPEAGRSMVNVEDDE